MTYKDSDGWEKTPVMIHRAIVGSPERFMWILIEHYAGAFPLWLAPVQIQLVPVAGNFVDYANQIVAKLKAQWLRVSIDNSDNSFSKKIRNAELTKVPYIVIVWEKEESTQTLSIREYRSKKQYETKIDEFINNCVEEFKNRK